MHLSKLSAVYFLYGPILLKSYQRISLYVRTYRQSCVYAVAYIICNMLYYRNSDGAVYCTYIYCVVFVAVVDIWHVVLT